VVKFLVSADEVSGKKVVSVKGDEIGQIKDVQFNMNNWTVTHMVIKLSNRAAVSLGYKKTIGSYNVCMPVNLISSVGDVVTINKTLLELIESAEIKECQRHTGRRGIKVTI
jgi:sporulation protein YlmC with PRC-barrel domain